MSPFEQALAPDSCGCSKTELAVVPLLPGDSSGYLIDGLGCFTYRTARRVIAAIVKSYPQLEADYARLAAQLNEMHARRRVRL